jgi:protein phosphatase 1 regulatory subunit 11
MSTACRHMTHRGTRTGRSSTVVRTEEGASTETPSAQAAPRLTLELSRRSVRWSSDTHNNEFDGKRSSKSCCIYHKPRRFDESSTESEDDGGGGDDGDDDSSSSSDGEDGEGGVNGGSSGGRRPHRRDRRGGSGGRRNPGVESDGSSSSDGGPSRRAHGHPRRPTDTACPPVRTHEASPESKL